MRIRHEKRQELVQERRPWVTTSRARLEGYFFHDPHEQYSLRDMLDDEYLVLEPDSSLLNLDSDARYFWTWMNARVGEWFETERFTRDEHHWRPADAVGLRLSDVTRARTLVEKWGRAEPLTGPFALRLRAIPYRLRFAARRLKHERLMKRPADS